MDVALLGIRDSADITEDLGIRPSWRIRVPGGDSHRAWGMGYSLAPGLTSPQGGCQSVGDALGALGVGSSRLRTWRICKGGVFFPL